MNENINLDNSLKEIEIIKKTLQQIKLTDPALKEGVTSIFHLLEQAHNVATDINHARDEWHDVFDAITDPVLLHDKK